MTVYIHMCVSIYVDRYTSSHRIASPGVSSEASGLFPHRAADSRGALLQYFVGKIDVFLMVLS